MDQIEIGNFIAKKRKEKNMTQAQLAQHLGVSDKTISKWETGKCIADYSIIDSLCEELDITVAEFINGKEAIDKSMQMYHDTQMLDLIKRTQVLEQQRASLYGFIVIIIGMILMLLHYFIGGSDEREFFSGFILGLSIIMVLTGVYVVIKGIAKK